VADQPGKNVTSGAAYCPFIVYDIDGDGKAEVVCRTADGTVDGVGKSSAIQMPTGANPKAQSSIKRRG